MALFSKKEPVEDQWGPKDLPFRTDARTLDDYGIYPIRGRTRRSMSVQKFIVLFLVISFVAFMTIVFFNSLKANTGVNRARAEIQNSASPAFKVRYASLGEEVIRAYYGGDKPVSNLLPSVPWPGTSESSSTDFTPVTVSGLQLIRGESTRNAIPENVLKQDKTKTFSNPINELLTYTGVIDGRQYTFTVNLVIPDIKDAKKLPYLTSPPTIQPMETLVVTEMEASKPDTDLNPPKYADMQLSEASTSRISEWASAYAQDNRETLKMIVGDGNVDAMYQGLGGYSLKGTPTVIWSYEHKENMDDPTEQGMIYARIAFSMETAVSSARENAAQQIQGDSSKDNTFAPEQVYDILLANYGEGTPNIVAWVPGGAWYTLEPKMNAIIVTDPGQKDEIRRQQQEASVAPTTTSENNSPSAPGAPGLEKDKKTKETTPTSTQKKDTKVNKGTGTPTPKATTTKPKGE